ncbi:hypothetical protein [Salinicola rhizosphaerae]|uniref:Uncharacterized protein n=1 Tax=Salinicola rhizosphaerae TaxID=1443141 RepID=A0ABQ3DWN6_9GAMM|nr:hypothetical protein [Salinicola rhizosphaerae]GHB13037.1 hypothetical protein GCM10009038_08880 [Salinicola rhizosphaerae]
MKMIYAKITLCLIVTVMLLIGLMFLVLPIDYILGFTMFLHYFVNSLLPETHKVFNWVRAIFLCTLGVGCFVALTLDQFQALKEQKEIENNKGEKYD